MSTIVRIETAGPQKRARRIYFDTDSEPLVTTASLARAVGLEEGMVVEPSHVAEQIAELEPELIRDRISRLLGYRDRSVAEVRTRLTDDGFARDTTKEITARFVELGILDDSRFAQLWAEMRCRSGFGRDRIYRELRTKGIAPSLVQAVLSETLDDDELERAVVALGQRTASTRKERDRLVGRLVSRGFSFGTAIEAVRARTISDQPEP